jgi:hypothetical protein
LAFGAVAQLGERLVCNQEATGSIPVSSTKVYAFVASSSRCSFRLVLDPYGSDKAGVQEAECPRVKYVHAQREADVFGFGSFLYLDCDFPAVRSQPDVGRQI